MVIELGTLVLDERIVERGEEVVGRRGAVVLLRVEPARGESGVPRERQLAFGRGAGRHRERDRRRRDRDEDECGRDQVKNTISLESGTIHSVTPLRGSIVAAKSALD